MKMSSQSAVSQGCPLYTVLPHASSANSVEIYHFIHQALTDCVPCRRRRCLQRQTPS